MKLWSKARTACTHAKRPSSSTCSALCPTMAKSYLNMARFKTGNRVVGTRHPAYRVVLMTKTSVSLRVWRFAETNGRAPMSEQFNPFATVKACVFDAYGTLFDVHSAVGAYQERV